MQWNPQMSRRLRLRDLHYLLTVVQAGSMAKATTALAVSQPVISKVIADMEHLLGEKLLDRSPRGVEPTIYGRRLLASSFAIFDELRQSVIEIEHLADPAAGELSIGSNEDSTLGIVPTVIKDLHRRHPRAFIQITLIGSPEDQKRELLQRSVEFVVGRVRQHVPDHDLETEVLFDEQFSVLAGADNPWAHRRRVELAELLDRPWIMPSRAFPGAQLFVEMFRGKGLEAPQGPVYTSSLQLTQRLLEEGPFLALLPTSIVPSLVEHSALRTVPVPLPDLVSPIGVIRLRNRELSPLARIFIEAARVAARAIPTQKERLPVEPPAGPPHQ